MSASPTQRSLKELRDRGYIAAVVERWNEYARIRQDLFGIIDVIGVGNNETIGVQATTDSNLSKRVHKMAESEHIDKLREAGWRLEAHGWKKKGSRWQVRKVDLS